MSKVVVFGDGPTSYLADYVQRQNNTSTDIVIRDEPAAGIGACISPAYQHVYEGQFDICVIMSGSQDLIHFDSYTDHYFFPYQLTEEFTEYLTYVYQEGETAFYSPLEPSSEWT